MEKCYFYTIIDLEKCKKTEKFALEKCIFSEAGQKSLYYFSSKKQGELDFVVEYAGNMLPIEVKSGKDYERHNALSNVLENEEYAVPMAYVFCGKNVQTKGRAIYYPIYMIPFLEQVQAEEEVYKFDLTGL